MRIFCGIGTIVYQIFNVLLLEDFQVHSIDYLIGKRLKTFRYSLKTFNAGKKRDLDEFDITEPLDEHKSSILGDRLAKNWSIEVRNAAKKKKPPSLARVIIKTFRWEIIIYGIVLFLMEFFAR